MSLGLSPVTVNSCCRTCKYCVSTHSALFAMCKVRKIKIHPEIGIFAFCHHWTKKEPALPNIKNKINDNTIEKQLDFGKVLVSNSN